jgi:hypothetical protein
MCTEYELKGLCSISWKVSIFENENKSFMYMQVHEIRVW